MTESAPAADWSWQDDPNVISWDWRQGPDLDELRDLLARHGLSVTEVDTGTDDVAIRISSTPVEVMEAAIAAARRDGAADALAYAAQWIRKVFTGIDPEIGRVLDAMEYSVRAGVRTIPTTEVDRVLIERFGDGPLREVLVTAEPDQRTSGGDLP